MSEEEFFDIVDKNGEIIGKSSRKEAHGNPELMHRSVHVLILNKKGKLFLQKRASNKDIQPGKWDSSVGGHVGLGEEIIEAAKRETEEELGIKKDIFHYMYRYLWRTEVETELVTSFFLSYDGPIKICIEEIEEGRFWSFEEIEDTLGKEMLTPNFEEEYFRLKEYLERREKVFQKNHNAPRTKKCMFPEQAS